MDLTHWITSAGRLSSENAVGWALRLAKTLALLHRRGLAHGAISPHAVEADGPECDAEAVLRPASRVPDDAAYLSTERVAGAAPTPADDVWAVGVVLYRALTGELPFADTARSGQQPIGVIQAVGAELAALQPVFDRVFHPDRAERIVTAHDLVVVLSGHHPRADELEPLELPTESVRLAHRVKHVSQPLLEAVRQEEDALPGLLGEDDPGGFDEGEPRRDSEEVFLGWLSEPPGAVEASPPPPAETDAPQPSTPAPDDAGTEAPEEWDDDWDDDDDDRPTMVRPLAPPMEPPDDERPPDPVGEAPAAAAAADFQAVPAEVVAADVSPAEPAAPPAVTPAAAALPPTAQAAPADPSPVAPGAPRQAKRSQPVALWVAVGGLALVVVAFGVYRMRGSSSPDRAPGATAKETAAPRASAARAAAATASAAPRATAATAASSPEVTATGSAPAVTASASSAPTASASSGAPPAAGDLTACMSALFPADTFTSGGLPSFERVCRRGHPRKGAEAIKTLVVAGGNSRALTTGMKEWSLLGWYSMAAFAVVHGHCCTSDIDVSHPSFKVCGLGDALAALHAAARDRPADLDGATDAYRKAASCTWRSNNAKMFQQTTQPTSQQLATYRKILDRMKR